MPDVHNIVLLFTDVIIRHARETPGVILHHTPHCLDRMRPAADQVFHGPQENMVLEHQDLGGKNERCDIKKLLLDLPLHEGKFLFRRRDRRTQVIERHRFFRAMGRKTLPGRRQEHRGRAVREPYRPRTPLDQLQGRDLFCRRERPLALQRNEHLGHLNDRRHLGRDRTEDIRVLSGEITFLFALEGHNPDAGLAAQDRNGKERRERLFPDARDMLV